MTAYLADTSAWHHSDDGQLVVAWEQRIADATLATCTQVRLEVLFSARSAREYDEFAAERSGLLQLPCGADQLERALEVQRALAHRRALHHRSVKIADLIIAASAEAGDAVLWHYDQDFDRIAEITGQATEWAAPRGSL